MELTEKQKDVALFNYWKADDCAAGECRANSLYAAVEAVLALERPSATEPAMKCRSCDTTTDKTPPFAACGICGAQLVDKVATEPAAQDEALVEKLEQVLRESFDCASFRTIAKDIIAVARQHFAAHPVTTQVVQKALIDRLTHEWYDMTSDPNDFRVSDDGKRFASHSEVARFIIRGLARLAPKQKTPGEPETVDALDQLAMSLQWEELYADDYKRRVLREAMQFVLQGGAHERTPTP